MITIPANTTLIGEIRSSGRLRIDGHVEGIGDIQGLLLLTSECVWKGTVTADIVIIEGTVEGDIIARKKLEVHAKANITGQLTSPIISIAQGARINGQMRMQHPQIPKLLESIPKKSDSSEQYDEQVASVVNN